MVGHLTAATPSGLNIALAHTQGRPPVSFSALRASKDWSANPGLWYETALPFLGGALFPRRLAGGGGLIGANPGAEGVGSRQNCFVRSED